MKISIIIPTINSQGYIDNTISSVDKYFKILKRDCIVKEYEILVIAQSIIELTPLKNLRMFLCTSQGKGIAINNGLKLSKHEKCLIYDDDLEYNFADIIKLIEKIKRNDIVIGSRLLKGSNRYSTPKKRILYSFLYRVLVNLFLKIKTKDIQSGMKLLKKQKINFAVNSTGFVWDTELIYKAERNNLKIKEVPITYSYIKKKKKSPNPFFMLCDFIKFYIKRDS